MRADKKKMITRKGLWRLTLTVGVCIIMASIPPGVSSGQAMNQKVYQDSVNYYRWNTNNYWNQIIKRQRKQP